MFSDRPFLLHPHFASISLTTFWVALSLISPPHPFSSFPHSFPRSFPRSFPPQLSILEEGALCTGRRANPPFPFLQSDVRVHLLHRLHSFRHSCNERLPAPSRYYHTVLCPFPSVDAYLSRLVPFQLGKRLAQHSKEDAPRVPRTRRERGCSVLSHHVPQRVRSSHLHQHFFSCRVFSAAAAAAKTKSRKAAVKQ